MTDDTDLIARMEDLVGEEQRLIAREATGRATYGDRAGLVVAQLTLDRLWDLLRQRRALREFELDPDAASLRDIDTVESYAQ
jgi:uncharacterized protein DUF2630